MAKTNLAIGEQVNLPEVLNKKLESPVLQEEVGLNAQASQNGKAQCRWKFQRHRSGRYEFNVPSYSY